MSDGQSNPSEPSIANSSVGDWPTFQLQYTFNPGRDRSLDPDDVFVFDPDRITENDTHWIAAKRGAYVAVEDVR